MRAAATTRKRKTAAERGFSLVELAIAMFIFGLIISSILEPAAELYQKRKNTEARGYIALASQAVMNYALHNQTSYQQIEYNGVVSFIPAGRPYLPCPDITGDGIEDRNAITPPIAIAAAANNNGTCMNQKGTIPWRTLRLQPVNDPWGNYLTYHVDAAYSNALLGFDETSRADRHDITRMPNAAGFFQQRANADLPFVVCGKPGANVAACTYNGNDIIAGVITAADINLIPYRYQGNDFQTGIVRGAVFVLVSHGHNGRYARRAEDGLCNGSGGIAGVHETRNGNFACDQTGAQAAQNFYLSYPISDHPATGEFDDIVRWTMANELMGSLSEASEMLDKGAESKSPLPIPKLPFLQ